MDEHSGGNKGEILSEFVTAEEVNGNPSPAVGSFVHNFDDTSLFELHVSFVTRKPDVLVTEERIFSMLQKIGRIKLMTFKKFSTHNPTGNHSGYGFAAYDDLEEALSTMLQLKDSLIEHISFDCHLSHRSMQKLTIQEADRVNLIIAQLEERRQMAFKSDKVNNIIASHSRSIDSDLTTRVEECSNAFARLSSSPSPNKAVDGAVADSGSSDPSPFSQYVSYYNSMASPHAPSSVVPLARNHGVYQHGAAYGSNMVSSPLTSPSNHPAFPPPQLMMLPPPHSHSPSFMNPNLASPPAAYYVTQPVNYPPVQPVQFNPHSLLTEHNTQYPHQYLHHYSDPGQQLVNLRLQPQHFMYQPPTHSYGMMAMPAPASTQSMMFSAQTGVHNFSNAYGTPHTFSGQQQYQHVYPAYAASPYPPPGNAIHSPYQQPSPAHYELMPPRRNGNPGNTTQGSRANSRAFDASRDRRSN
eukprot:gene32547-39353_t